MTLFSVFLILGCIFGLLLVIFAFLAIVGGDSDMDSDFDSDFDSLFNDSEGEEVKEKSD